jgi:DNA polymerase-1
MSEPRVGLLDTDIFAYRLALRNEERTAFGTVVGELSEAFKQADEIVAHIVKRLKLDRVILCLSSKENFRYEVLPTYKSNRDGTVRPELLQDVKDYLADEYESKGYPRLEADDVMGILSTHPYAITGKKIIVSEDKDMRTIPGFLYAPHRDDLNVIEVSELDADRFLMWQTMCGDMTDGYGGAKGVGKASEYAKDIIFADREELWDEVLHAYAMVGKTEDDAIQQARMARILRHEDYNIHTGEIDLWTPLKLVR